MIAEEGKQEWVAGLSEADKNKGTGVSGLRGALPARPVDGALMRGYQAKDGARRSR